MNQTLTQFLKSTPLYTKVRVNGFLEKMKEAEKRRMLMSGVTPSSLMLDSKIYPQFFCESEGCKSFTYFEGMADSEVIISLRKKKIHRLSYRCRNCMEVWKQFFVEIEPDLTDEKQIENVEEQFFYLQKVGQLPRYGDRAPQKALKLIGKERELFFKGLNCEREGMGRGAFSYFRRVIDAQKNKIFDEIIKVLENSSGNEILIKELKEARNETQFTSSVDKIKAGIPEILKVGGQNPLYLLYAALSEGLHVHNDDECLELAYDIKLVLYEFAERLEIALKSNQQLQASVSRLLERKKK